MGCYFNYKKINTTAKNYLKPNKLRLANVNDGATEILKYLAKEPVYFLNFPYTGNRYNFPIMAKLSFSLSLSLSNTHARARAHTHTHTYIYIYI